MPKQPKRLRLKGWLQGESLRENLKLDKSTEDWIEILYSYLTLIFDEQDWHDMPWIEVAQHYQLGVEANQLTIDFPMLRPRDRESQKLPWEYPERNWYVWANMFASRYSWTLDYIAELDIDDAVGLMQEILTDDHLAKEWQWNLSELTYSYDSTTKQSKHTEYPRPTWMLPIQEAPKPVKIPKSLLPVGLVISTEDDFKH
jgi:hypothetical protein